MTKTPTFNKPLRMLGKRAPRLDPRTFKLSHYVPPTLPAPPVKDGYIEKVGTWPMYLNDELGDCVIAAAGHMIDQWTAYSGSEKILSDADILTGYERVGGYKVGDETTDNGCDMLTSLKYWRSTGYGGHKIVAFAKVDHTSENEIQQAIAMFGSVYAGFVLPLSSQNPTYASETSKPCWSVPKTGLVGDGSVGSWGGHCVPLVGYSADPKGTPGTMVVTWGALYDVTWNFVKAYADEMFVVLSQDWINAESESPSGFKLAQLQADLAAL